MKVGVFPEAFLRAMSAKDRQALGQMTAAEAQQRHERGEEKALKAVVVNWLLLQGCWIFTQGMHRKTGGQRGTPDLIVCASPDGRFRRRAKGKRQSTRARTGHGDREDPCGGRLRDSGLLPA